MSVCYFPVAGGTQLKTTGVKAEEVKAVEKPENNNAAAAPKAEDADSSKMIIPGEKDVLPVGKHMPLGALHVLTVCLSADREQKWRGC